VHLILDAEYSNMDSSDPFDNTPRATVTVQDLSLEWNTGTTQVHYSNSELTAFSAVSPHVIGVHLSTRGSMGNFKPFLVVTAVVYVIVLLKLASLMVDTFARIFIKSFSAAATTELATGDSKAKAAAGNAQVHPAQDSTDLISQVMLLKDSFLYSARSDAQRDHELHDLNRKVVELRKRIEKMDQRDSASPRRGGAGGDASAAARAAPAAQAQAPAPQPAELGGPAEAAQAS